jgi:NAD(P)-dependent dehydrogenase (short-subunit alcohol dehydrogenase family)
MAAERRSRVVAVTGANRGIGLELTRQLARRGDTVILGSRDAGRGERALESLGPLPGTVLVRPLDVTATPDTERLAAELADRFGHVDVLINNAAIHYDTGQTAAAADLAIVAEALDTNLLGPWRVTMGLLPLLRASAHGRIVNVSSEAGSLASMGGGLPAYQTSKAALNALTRTLAAELRPDGILVNAVWPGWVATDMGGPGGQPVALGAERVLWAADLPDSGPTGGFYRDGRPVPW